MSLAVEEVAKTTKGKEALAIEAFAKALRSLPTIICDNAGYDSAELVQNLRSELANGNSTAGKYTSNHLSLHGADSCDNFQFDHVFMLSNLKRFYRFEHD